MIVSFIGVWHIPDGGDDILGRILLDGDPPCRLQMQHGILWASGDVGAMRGVMHLIERQRCALARQVVDLHHRLAHGGGVLLHELHPHRVIEDATRDLRRRFMRCHLMTCKCGWGRKSGGALGVCDTWQCPRTAAKAGAAVRSVGVARSSDARAAIENIVSLDMRLVEAE